MKFLLLLLIGFICAAPCFAQSSEVDSLEQLLKNRHLPDTSRINTCNDLAYDYYTLDPIKGVKYAQSAIALATRIKSTQKLAMAYNYLALNYSNLGNDSLALTNYQTAINTARNINYRKGEGIVLNNLAIFYTNRSEYQKALDARLKALSIFQELKNKQGIYILTSNIAVNYIYLADYPRSLAYSFKALEIAQADSNLKVIGSAYMNIGLVYKKTKNYAKAITYYQHALKLYNAAGSKSDEANTLDNLGSVYDEMGQSAKALVLYRQALAIAQAINYQHGKMSYLTDIGTMLNELQQYTAAVHTLNEALAICKLSPDKNVESVIFNELAQIFNEAPADSLKSMGYTVKAARAMAEAYVNNTITISKSTGLPEREMDGWKLLSRIHEKQKNYAAALTDYKKYTILKDSIFNDEKRQAIQNSEVKFIYDKKEALKQVDTNRQLFIKNMIITGAVLFALLALLVFLFYKKYRDNRQVQQELLLKARISDTEMRVLRLQLNPHFIFNSLNSISDYIGKNDIQKADYYLVKFARLMRATLENSEEKEIPLAEELRMIELYIQLEAMRLNNTFDHHIRIADGIDPKTTMVPPLILQPFVENSIWHGMANKADRGVLTIEITRDNDLLNCVVEDDGIGRLKAAPSNKKSYGVKITRDRIDLLNKLNNTQASINLIDLQQGTKVEIKLPLEIEA